MEIHINISAKQKQALQILTQEGKAELLFGGAAGCFHGRTLVLTDRGHKQINQIQIGEKVLSFNEYFDIKGGEA